MRNRRPPRSRAVARRPHTERATVRMLGLLLLYSALIACGDSSPVVVVGGDARVDSVAQPPARFSESDAAPATDPDPTPSDEEAGGGASTPDGADAPPRERASEDASELVAYSFPFTMTCGSEATATVTMRNTGTTTWTRAGGYKLGAADDSDPLKLGDLRIWLDEDDSVPPGAEHVFEIPLKAAEVAGPALTDWRMVHEAIAWFGPTAAATVDVVCDEVEYPLPLPDMSDVVDGVAAAHPDLLAGSCQDEGGTWEFLDLVVSELRGFDERWGYNWKRGVVGDPSQDVVDYHFGPGESEGSTDVYIIDVIVGHCGPNPAPGWIDQTQATADAGEIGRWTSMGKF